MVDYLSVIAEGVVAGEGTPEDMLASTDPIVHRFLHAEPEGPIGFHYAAQSIGAQLGLKELRPHPSAPPFLTRSWRV